MSRKQLLIGTLILTSSGIITRILGFFYKIYLSNTIGAVNLGLYQLVFPIYAICHTIYVSGIQTSLSQKIATLKHDKTLHQNSINYLIHALFLSFIPAVLLSIIIYANADFIANRILLESSTAMYIKNIVVVFPFCSFTSCMNGYYYGLKKTLIPALSQFVEQFCRVSIIILLVSSGIFNKENGALIAVVGLIIGELAAAIFSFIALLLRTISNHLSLKICIKKERLKQILSPAIPLTSNHLLLNILSAIESTLIPFLLKNNGLNNNDALSLYGILMGMSIPFILFPSAVVNSYAVMLLPEISQANSQNDKVHIVKTINDVIYICASTGIFALFIFIEFGTNLGILIFNNSYAGEFISSLAYICPFVYLSTSLNSILNGLGKNTTVFINNLISMILRIFMLVILIPKIGVNGYLVALAISLFFITILNFICTKHYINFQTSYFKSIILPAFFSFGLIYLGKKIYIQLTTYTMVSRMYNISCLFIIILLASLSYLALLLKLHTKKK